MDGWFREATIALGQLEHDEHDIVAMYQLVMAMVGSASTIATLFIMVNQHEASLSIIHRQHIYIYLLTVEHRHWPSLTIIDIQSTLELWPCSTTRNAYVINCNHHQCD